MEYKVGDKVRVKYNDTYGTVTETFIANNVRVKTDQTEVVYNCDEVEIINEPNPVSMDTKEVNERILTTPEMIDGIFEDLNKRFKVEDKEKCYVYVVDRYYSKEERKDYPLCLMSVNSEGKESPFMVNAYTISHKWVEISNIQLSEDEIVILSNIDSKYKWIARDKSGELFMYMDKLFKSEYGWETKGGYITLGMFNHLFQFIKWEDQQAWNIEELLQEEG